MSAPLPPTDLAVRVGVIESEEALASFDDLGRRAKERLVGLLPDGFFAGRRILDFGCGPGKTLRHFLADAERCEFHGCDIHEPSVRWVNENLSPPFRAAVCSETPPLPYPDEHFDLVYALSVFTHITDFWADWLLEMRRILKPDGYLVATFLGQGMSESIAWEPWDPDRVGMNVLNQWQAWDQGGPSVQHSEWWLRAHWGRAFLIEDVQDTPRLEHGWLVARKQACAVTRENLIAPADDPREVAALRHNVEQLAVLATAVARDREAVDQSRRQAWEGLDLARRETASVEARLRAEIGRSWRVTRLLQRVRRTRS